MCDLLVLELPGTALFTSCESMDASARLRPALPGLLELSHGFTLEIPLWRFILTQHLGRSPIVLSNKYPNSSGGGGGDQQSSVSNLRKEVEWHLLLSYFLKYLLEHVLPRFQSGSCSHLLSSPELSRVNLHFLLLPTVITCYPF